MTLHETHLIAFAAGSVIHGIQAVLVWQLGRDAGDSNRREAREGLAICLLAFLWQAGNFWRELALTLHYGDATLAFRSGRLIESLALLGFPVTFSYMIPEYHGDSRIARLLTAAGRGLRSPLWIFSAVAALAMVLLAVGVRTGLDPDWPLRVTLNLMLFYFAVFFVLDLLRVRSLRAGGSLAMLRAHKAAVLASFLGSITFFLMLWSPGSIGRNPWLELAAMMTSVPFTIAMAYRLYQFPFMDAFLREVLSGVALLTAFCLAWKLGPASPALLPLWTAAVALSLAFAKQPVSRWVDRRLLGYAETVEDQEERIAAAVRGLSQLEDFTLQASEILRLELEADWVAVDNASRPDAVARFFIPGSTPLWLSLGPRQGARTYMSRQLRVAGRAVLELANQQGRLQRDAGDRQQLVQQHELREITTRAQIQALQAQIDPHFLFNTLNVLAGLIHTNPARAEHVTEDLAEIFRYALESTRLDRVRVDDELRFVASYLEIEKARFENRLRFTFQADAAVRRLGIPPMILQPLVENAIRHGIGPKIEGGEVRIIARADAQQIMISIEDTGVGLSHRGSRGSGIGLPNVRERLAHIYGGGAELRLEAMRPAGTRALLVLPRKGEVAE